ncbi:MAG: site-specific integrase, partial [Phycisphaerales bacterium]|nr:site-specific integrase [Phycisphaerales bacterium]
YRRAITRACDQAFPPPPQLKGESLARWIDGHRWTPGQLRHNKATEVASKIKIEVARDLLGHTDIATTLRYVKVEDKRLIRAARKLG